MTPYRHIFFEELSKIVNLTVCYLSKTESGRSWQIWPRNYSYNYYIIRANKYLVNLNFIKLFLEKPDIIILSGYNDPIIILMFFKALLFKIPFIYWTEGISEPHSLRFASRARARALGLITRPLRVFLVKKSRAIVVPGKISKNYVNSLGADLSKVFIAPNAIDNELFFDISNKYLKQKKELKEKLGLENKIIILYVGRIIKIKGPQILLEVYKKIFKNYNNIVLVFVGSGNLLESLKEICIKKGINNVIFTGSINNYKNLIGYYSISDIFVMPTFYDLWGFVINEAMTCGLPIISTYESQAASEMLHSGENGYIIKAGDEDELYKDIIKLISDSNMRVKMGEKSKDIVKNQYNVKKMTKGFLYAIKYILGDVL